MHLVSIQTLRNLDYMTPKRDIVLLDGPIGITVPPLVREQQKLEEELEQKTLVELKNNVVDLQNIPQAVIDTGKKFHLSYSRRFALNKPNKKAFPLH